MLFSQRWQIYKEGCIKIIMPLQVQAQNKHTVTILHMQVDNIRYMAKVKNQGIGKSIMLQIRSWQEHGCGKEWRIGYKISVYHNLYSGHNYSFVTPPPRQKTKQKQTKISPSSRVIESLIPHDIRLQVQDLIINISPDEALFDLETYDLKWQVISPKHNTHHWKSERIVAISSPIWKEEERRMRHRCIVGIGL